MLKKRLLAILLFICCIAVFAGCGNMTDNNTSTQGESITTPSEISLPESHEENPQPDLENKEQNDLGAMTPEEALDYMKKTDDLIIVDVAAERWYDEEHFEGAINIPIESLDSEAEDALYMQIPSDRPVLLHCRRGVIVPGAYRRLKELRPDIPEIGYIDGVPPFAEYNAWIAQSR